MDYITDSKSHLFTPLKCPRLSLTYIDEIRQENAAYEYLCHLEEARLWIEACIQETLPHSTELEARLRNGVYLAKLGNFIAPHVVPLKKIFDIDQSIYDSSGLHYRHTDNINHWILAMKAIGLPSYFYPNSFDVYGKKNMPKAIYCLHALNIYLHRCGKGMKILDLMGKIQFSSDEISSVTQDFKLHGIQLPAFHKIGGILANEILSNDASLHAAIIAINIAIGHRNSDHLFAAMMNPNAQLQNVIKQNAKFYQTALSRLKTMRVEEVKSKTATHKIELCWEFLPQKAIQEEINTVNMKCILNELKNAVASNDKESFINILQNPLLDASDFVLENVEAYMSHFKDALEPEGLSVSSLEKVHNLVSTANFEEYKYAETNSAVENLNFILSTDDYVSSFNILKSLALGVHLHDFGRQFYHMQLENIKINKKRPLNLNDLAEDLPKLTALLDLSISVIHGDADETYEALSKKEIKSWNLYENLKEEYLYSLKLLNIENSKSLLTVDLVQECVSEINTRYELNQNEIISTVNVNAALSTNNMPLLINSLMADPSILSVDLKHTQLYFNLLSKCQSEKNDFELTRSDIQSQINKANKLVLEAEYYCAILASINMAIDNKDANVLFDSLKILMDIGTLCSVCKDKYLKDLAAEKDKKNHLLSVEKNNCQYSWIKWEVLPSITYFLNMITLDSSWNLDENLPSIFLAEKEITNAISTTQTECQCYKYEVLETLLVSFQAFARGYLVRKKTSSRKMKLSRVYTPEQATAAVKVQSFLRMSIVRKKYLEQRAKKLRLEAAARAIQRCWRSFKVFKNLDILAHSSNPPLPLMQNIIFMLETSNDDYYEEFKLHTIKGKAVQTIRYNQSLLKEIDEMDLKIGLLIRNRISLEDLLIQKKRASMRVKKRETSIADIRNQNFKLFSKNYNTLVESYENLLYVLQTKPEYLSRLIVSLPSNQATSLIESIIFSLYNYGSTPREEYLLLKMLCLTLDEEINLRGDISDIIKGENMILKIIISFYRKSYWRDCLKSLIEPLVSEVLKDKCILHSIDPVEIYKVWQNELETQTGKKSVMSQEVTVDDALAHQEVDNRFNQFLEILLKYSLMFCEAIVNGQELIPYGIMYVCKFLKMALLRKYPASSMEELYKIIGNFLYYRYINPAIIAPDVFDVISSQPSKLIADHERMKLSAIAKFLHFAVTGQKYSEDASHLMCLNPYLSDCHQKFVALFNDVCSVKSLEENFNIDMFSEALVQIPEVYMSLKELQTLHKLLIEKEYDIAPDPDDLLHEIFEDFKPEMLDDVCHASEEFLKTEICLSLKPKYELEVDDESEEEKIFVESKFMLITLMQVLMDAGSILELLDRDITEEEEMKFEKICCMKQREAEFSRNWIIRSRDWKTLPDLQAALQYNLNYLELHGFVSSKNNYQDILNSIAKDIVNRWRYRISRKREISKLLEVQKQLDQKTIYFLEKLDYYNRYIAVCLENMKIGKRNANLFICRSSVADQVLHSKTVKCSGSKLFEKGILIEIKDLETSQFKNVNFEISPTEDLGVFLIKAKFMGIPLETNEIDIQQLLCMQYQGISEMTIFDCAKINNNLLLHFLNSKFYSKKVL